MGVPIWYLSICHFCALAGKLEARASTLRSKSRFISDISLTVHVPTNQPWRRAFFMNSGVTRLNRGKTASAFVHAMR